MPSDTAILIVEDDENVRSLLEALAKKYCSRLDLAPDGAEALRFLRQHEYNLVILDIMLPKVNGLEVAEAIRTMPVRPKIVVLSAISRYFKDHFDDDITVLQKPFDINRVEDILKMYGGVQRATTSS